MSCETCQKQFFPYLYDLLEPAERLALETHLGGCPHCQAELERSRSRRAEIASAVKHSFPDIVFKAPRGPGNAPRASWRRERRAARWCCSAGPSLPPWCSRYCPLSAPAGGALPTTRGPKWIRPTSGWPRHRHVWIWSARK